MGKAEVSGIQVISVYKITLRACEDIFSHSFEELNILIQEDWVCVPEFGVKLKSIITGL